VRPPPFDALFAPCTYDAPVDQLVRGLKFQGTLSHGRVLGLLLAAHRRMHCAPLPTLVVPMPLHRERFAERGFNQAEVIARAAAGALGLPVRSGLLQRLRGGARQSGLGAAARRANLQLAGCGPIALVDDVFTTGSTARAAAQALKSAGAPRVEVWAATRALAMEDSPIC
jgi:ComF family protein